MDNEWLTQSTLRLPAGNGSLFWLLGENDRMKVLTHFYLNWQGVLTVKAKIKSRIYVFFWSDKKQQLLAVYDVLSVMVFEQTNVLLWFLSGVRLWLLAEKNTPVYSNKSRASQSSQHDITAPEPSLISFINLQLPP